MTILIVDDAEDIRLLLGAILSSAGYDDLIMAESAKKAYEILDIDLKRPSGDPALEIDLILLDIVMKGVDGIEACKKIKSIENYKDLPIIMVTAKNKVESLDAAFEAGAIDYITKPLNRVELLARVRSELKLKHEMDTKKAREKELAMRNEELEKAIKEINTLRGLIPICAHCKKVRNTKGAWQQVEVYVSEHTEAKFSHGICESCAKDHYPLDLNEVTPET